MLNSTSLLPNIFPFAYLTNLFSHRGIFLVFIILFINGMAKKTVNNRNFFLGRTNKWENHKI